MKAAVYARFSTDKQSESSITDQLRVCRRLAERHGFAVVAEFSDAAISGGTTARPGYQDLLTAARRGDFSVIVAEDTSRLWRSMAEQAPRIAELRDLGVYVVTHDLDTRTESSAVLGAVLGAMGEGYRQEIARRTRRGLEGLARSGKPTGGRAYGYVAVDKAVVVDQVQAEVVRRIFAEYIDGASPRAIAARLNAEGMASPGATWNRSARRRDGKWLASAIAGDPTRGIGILNNDAYRGVVVWNRGRWIRSAADSKRRRQVMNPRADWIERRDESLRIVSDELWQRVKARQGQRSAELGASVRRGIERVRRPGGGRPARYLFSGLLKCHLCGSSLTLSGPTHYSCASHVNGGACENRRAIRRARIETKLLAGMKLELKRPAVVAEVKRQVAKALADLVRPPVVDTKRISELQVEVDNLTDAVARGALRSSPAIGRRLAEKETELEQLQAVADRPPVDIARIVPKVEQLYFDKVDGLEKLPGLDPDRARAAIVAAAGPSLRVVPDGADFIVECSLPLPGLVGVEQAYGNNGSGGRI